MIDSKRRSRGAPKPAANDNVSQRIRHSRLDWLEEQNDIRGGVYRTFKLMVSLADTDGRFHIDGAAFERALKVTRRTVFNHTKTLVTMGMITPTGEKRWVHSYYKLTLPADAQPSASDPEITSRGPDKNSDVSGNSCAHKTPTYTYDQSASHEVSKILESIKGKKAFAREAGFTRRVDSIPPLEPGEGAHIPREIRESFLAEFGLSKARAWLFPCEWNDQERVLHPKRPIGVDWFRDHAVGFRRWNRLQVRLKGTGDV